MHHAPIQYLNDGMLGHIEISELEPDVLSGGCSPRIAYCVHGVVTTGVGKAAARHLVLVVVAQFVRTAHRSTI